MASIGSSEPGTPPITARGTPVKDHSADLMLPRTPAPREPRRFSPLNAPQRAVVDAFCEQTRPWALRQAARPSRPPPEERREQAVDQALRERRTGAPVGVDRRTLHAELAEELTEALRRVHVGWCLNQAAPLWREGSDLAPPAPPVEARQ